MQIDANTVIAEIERDTCFHGVIVKVSNSTFSFSKFRDIVKITNITFGLKKAKVCYYFCVQAETVAELANKVQSFKPEGEKIETIQDLVSTIHNYFEFSNSEVFDSDGKFVDFCAETLVNIKYLAKKHFDELGCREFNLAFVKSVNTFNLDNISTFKRVTKEKVSCKEDPEYGQKLTLPQILALLANDQISDLKITSQYSDDYFHDDQVKYNKNKPVDRLELLSELVTSSGDAITGYYRKGQVNLTLANCKYMAGSFVA